MAPLTCTSKPPSPARMALCSPTEARWLSILVLPALTLAPGARRRAEGNRAAGLLASLVEDAGVLQALDDQVTLNTGLHAGRAHHRAAQGRVSPGFEAHLLARFNAGVRCTVSSRRERRTFNARQTDLIPPILCTFFWLCASRGGRL